MRQALTALLLVIFVGGCQMPIVPETPRQKLTAAEKTYQATGKTILGLHARGLLKEEAVRLSIEGAVRTTRAALDAWHKSPDDPKLQLNGITALRALQRILDEVARATAKGGGP